MQHVSRGLKHALKFPVYKHVRILRSINTRVEVSALEDGYFTIFGETRVEVSTNENLILVYGV